MNKLQRLIRFVKAWIRGERISGVALKRGLNVLHMRKPNRHYHAVRVAIEEKRWTPPIRIHEHGFYSTHEEFLNREEARIVARASGQIKKGQTTISSSELFSEDLW